MTKHNDTGIEQIHLLDRCEDSYGGVRVEIKEDMDADVMKADVFASLLRASISSWKQQGKKGVWIKLPIKSSHLVDIIVKEGFRYHHAEPTYLMLVCWLPETSDTPDTIPDNASHRVGVGAFVLNDKREVLVVQEHSGRFQGTGVWKLPTGVVNEGEDICDAVVREVKEETGVDTKFVEVLCFRQSHKSFFTKSDLFFLCVLQPESSAIDKQNVEIEAAQWMPIEEYAKQPFVVNNKQFNFMANICLVKADHGYPGFNARATTTRGGKRNYIYCNKPEIVDNFASLM
ncbi:hypothetical protein ACJRO7_030234 [Eucalyptus globulus]|uniref:Nudix hydrolase domain-containing protein n=1 Tax=Eucalyptus globulus TaxID=34317 RepID=A0ABD3JDT2_EUCGL